jgi:hypothetical protein
MRKTLALNLFILALACLAVPSMAQCTSVCDNESVCVTTCVDGPAGYIDPQPQLQQTQSLPPKKPVINDVSVSIQCYGCDTTPGEWTEPTYTAWNLASFNLSILEIKIPEIKPVNLSRIKSNSFFN